MTINQINIIIAAAKEGTISGAAKVLKLSQPNVSNGIRMVEEEIGFPIFLRTQGGIKITEKGRIFLEHAHNIILEKNMIMDIGKQEPVLQLRIGHTSSSGAFNAFKNFCAENKEIKKADLKINSCSLTDGMHLLNLCEIDILVTITLPEDATILGQYAEDYKLEQIKIAEQRGCLNLRKDHPLLSSGLVGDSQDNFIIDMKGKQHTDLLRELSNYPMAYYGKFSSGSAPIQTFRTTNYPCSYIILVDSIEDRLRLISVTNAFSLSITTSEEIKKLYNLVSIPVTGYDTQMYCFVRNGEIARPEISRYISILKSLT